MKIPEKAKQALLVPVRYVLVETDGSSDTLANWVNAFFQTEATNNPASQKCQQSDIVLFRKFMLEIEGSDNRLLWTRRVSSKFIDHLQQKEPRLSDRTINRVIASLKPLAKWIDWVTSRPDSKLPPFPLGNPMRGIKSLPITGRLDIFRALEETERRHLLDAADKLILIGGLSKDQTRFKNVTERPRVKNARPYRDRAIIYLLCGSPTRRIGVSNLKLEDIDFKNRTFNVLDKGGIINRYDFNTEASKAMREYIEKERDLDNQILKSPYLFLPCATKHKAQTRLQPQSINIIWRAVAQLANVQGKTPHSARHYHGRKIGKALGASAVQKTLRHSNAVFSLQYMDVKEEEIKAVLEG